MLLPGITQDWLTSFCVQTNIQCFVFWSSGIQTVFRETSGFRDRRLEVPHKYIYFLSKLVNYYFGNSELNF